MTRHSGKQHRRKNNCPPSVPEQLRSWQNYGIITRYHGGASRNMTLMVMDGHPGPLVEVKHVPLKGSLKSTKCKQLIIVGSFVIYERGQVTLIYTTQQRNSVPHSVQESLLRSLPADARQLASATAVEDTHFYSSDSEDDMFYQLDTELEAVATAVTVDLDCI